MRRRNPSPELPPPPPWAMPLADFLGQHEVYRDFGPWAEDLHLHYAKRWVKPSLRVIVTPRGTFGVARIHGDPRGVVLLRRYEASVHGPASWSPVGAYRVGDLGIIESERGKGLGPEIVLQALEQQGRSFYHERGFSPGGLKTFVRAHRLAVLRALIDGKPVPRRVALEHPDAVLEALGEASRRLSAWQGAVSRFESRGLRPPPLAVQSLRRASAAHRRLVSLSAALPR